MVHFAKKRDSFQVVVIFLGEIDGFDGDDGLVLDGDSSVYDGCEASGDFFFDFVFA